MVRDLRLRQVVCRHDDRASTRGLVVNDVVDRLRGWEIDARQWFVQKKDLMILSQALCDEDPLALSA